jgi:hypothetical protein
MTNQPTRGAFNQGTTPTITCINEATEEMGVDLNALITALQAYTNDNIVPIWSTPATLVQAAGFQPGNWAMVFLDDADQADALGYHDLTPDGLPIAKIFVKTTLADKQLVSVTASHELAEMLVDPAINMMTTGPDATTIYAYESADPVEESSFPVKGIQMSDFVYPSYFETFHQPGSVRFDQMGLVNQPFQILPGGYQITFKDGKWGQVFGSTEKKKAFAREDRNGHRSEQRGVPLKKWVRSEIKNSHRRAA